MIDWLKSLFKPQCKHSFSQWQIVKRMSSSKGDVAIIQVRECSKCGFTELNKQEV